MSSFLPPVILLQNVEGERPRTLEWMVRNIPRGLMKMATIADVVEGQSIKLLVIEAEETH